VIVIVVGTGTDVGKTHVSCALLAHAARAGMRVSAWKPVVSGASPGDGDHVSLAAALGAEAEPPLFTFADPISPHLCARRAGVAISVDAIAARALELEAGGVDALLVETAGGLFSPLGQGVFTVDLCLALPSARVLLVAPDRLGVLHDVAATLLAGQGRGLAAPAVALSAPALPDASTGTNARELAWALGVEVAAVFPRASMDTPQIELAAAEAWRALRAMRPGGEPRSAAAGGAGRATPAGGGPGSPGAPDALREVAELLAADRAEPRGHGGVDTSGALRRLARAHDALLDAFWQGARRADPRCVEIALALDPLLVLGAPLEEHAQLLEQAGSIAARAADREGQADLLFATARIWTIRGAHGVAAAALHEASALVSPTDAARLSVLSGYRAYVLAGQTRLDEAEAEGRAALEAAALVSSAPIRERLAAFAHQNLGLTAEARGDGPLCLSHLSQAASMARGVRAERMLALALTNLAMARTVALGRAEREAMLRESRAIFLALGDALHASKLRVHLALLPGGDADLRGPAALSSCLDEARALGDAEIEAELLLEQAERARAAGDLAFARAAAAQVLPLRARLDRPATELRLSALLAVLDGRDHTPPRLLRISADGRALSFAEQRLDLSSRRALPRVVVALARARLDGARGLDVPALFAAGWPGELASASSAAARVYMAVRTLRQLGLHRAIQTFENLYLFDPDIDVILEAPWT
jgi:dethiobiotin synthetase